MTGESNGVSSEGESPISLEPDSLETHSSGSSEDQAPPPHEEQRRYWERDLRFKKVSLYISGGGFLAIIVALGFNWFQSNRVEKSIRANVQNSVLNHVLVVDKVFLEKPHLVPYFYEGKPVTDKDEKYQEVVITAEMLLDIFDLISAQNRNFLEFWDDPQAWDEWIIDTFTTSPILRETLDKRSRWYSQFLLDLRAQAQRRLEEKAARETTHSR